MQGNRTGGRAHEGDFSINRGVTLATQIDTLKKLFTAPRVAGEGQFFVMQLGLSFALLRCMDEHSSTVFTLFPKTASRNL